MKNQIFFLMILTLLVGNQLVIGQAKKKKMPRNINMLGYDNFGPAISGDGNSMVYMSNYTNDGGAALMYTKKISASSWQDPKELPRTVNIPSLTFMHGYCLSFDGTELYFTFKKSGGLGGFDLWKAKRTGNVWGGGQNLGSPLNSALNDGSPSISADGKSLYFMSCETMTNESASGCQLMMSIRSNKKSKWRKPTPLSNLINKGNSQSPNILADGQTLMYLSDHEGSMQWFITRLEADGWTSPKNMEFLKPNNLRNISIPAKGRYVFHDVPGERGSAIEKLLIPEPFKPKNVMRIFGTLASAEEGTLKVYDVDTRDRVIFETLKNGDNYDFVLIEGNTYDVSFESNNPSIPHISEIFDLIEMRNSTRRKWNIKPQLMNIGDSLNLRALKFDTISLDLEDESVYELRRLTRFLSKNQEAYEITIFHYPLDTVSEAELSMEIDTAYQSMNANMVTIQDSKQLEANSDSDSSFVSSELTIDEVSEVLAPTIAEKLAKTLRDKLEEKNISKESCEVNSVTFPLKGLNGNEKLANRILVYFKKVN